MQVKLACLKVNMPEDRDMRFAVNDVTDGTGAQMNDQAASKALTQRPDMMLVVALAQTGVRIVNRNSIAVAEWEMKHAMDKKLGEGRKTTVEGKEFSYRPITAGTMIGSTHYISGALTELNWNIKSEVAEGGAAGMVGGSRSYYISVAVDLMVTDTQTTELLMARSYSKQIVGREKSLGLFRFFDVGLPTLSPKELFEFNLGSQANEPVQTAVRWMLEAAAYDIIGEITGTREHCDDVASELQSPYPIHNNKS